MIPISKEPLYAHVANLCVHKEGGARWGIHCQLRLRPVGPAPFRMMLVKRAPFQPYGRLSTEIMHLLEIANRPHCLTMGRI